MNNVLSELTASEFLRNGYSLAPIGYSVYDEKIFPCYNRIMTYKSNEEIFHSPLTVISFYRDLKTLYHNLIDLLGNIMVGRYIANYISYNSSYVKLINDLIVTNPPMDPMVKLFLTDFYGFLALNKKTNGLQHIHLCDRRLKDFNLTDPKGIFIGLDKNETEKNFIDGNEPEIQKILLRLGTANTLALMKILASIVINYAISKNRKYLDELIPSITHIRSPIGMAANDAEWNTATKSGSGSSGTPIPPVGSPVSRT